MMNKLKKTNMPQVAAGKIAAGTVLQLGVAAYGAYSANKQGRAMRRQSAEQARIALAARKEQQEILGNKEPELLEHHEKEE